MGLPRENYTLEYPSTIENSTKNITKTNKIRVIIIVD
jgi:hypothetical protein